MVVLASHWTSKDLVYPSLVILVNTVGMANMVFTIKFFGSSLHVTEANAATRKLPVYQVVHVSSCLVGYNGLEVRKSKSKFRSKNNCNLLRSYKKCSTQNRTTINYHKIA